MNRLVLLGHPVAHSLSPRLHAAAFVASGLLDWSYRAIEVAPEELRLRWRALIAGDEGGPIRGGNLTVPHKRAVLPWLDEVDDSARGIGAVNTFVVARDGRVTGSNTDVDGVIGPLRERGIDFSSDGRADEHRGRADENGGAGGRTDENRGRASENRARTHAVVLGAGGAARAAVCALFELRASHVTVLARRPERAERLRDDLESLRPQECRVTVDSIARVSEYAGAAETRLVVNATTVGLDDPLALPCELPLRRDTTPAHAFDCVYRSAPTRWLTHAEERGWGAIDGREMLLHQAYRAFEIWTGRAAPRDAMRRVITDSGESD